VLLAFLLLLAAGIKAARPYCAAMDELALCVYAYVLASCSACLLRESATACRRPLRGQNLACLLARMLRALQCAVRTSAPGHSRVPAARACLAPLATREQTRAPAAPHPAR